jgi:hypothetical protein
LVVSNEMGKLVAARDCPTRAAEHKHRDEAVPCYTVRPLARSAFAVFLSSEFSGAALSAAGQAYMRRGFEFAEALR